MSLQAENLKLVVSLKAGLSVRLKIKQNIQVTVLTDNILIGDFALKYNNFEELSS